MFFIKQNDTSPSLQGTATDADGVAVPVTGASIQFHMRKSGATTPKVSAAGTIVDGPNGIMKYDWITGDTDTTGLFYGEFQVTYSGGAIETFPNKGYIKIRISAELD